MVEKFYGPDGSDIFGNFWPNAEKRLNYDWWKTDFETIDSKLEFLRDNFVLKFPKRGILEQKLAIK